MPLRQADHHTYIERLNANYDTDLPPGTLLEQFTFRAECLDDVIELRKVLYKNGVFHQVTAVLGGVYPDVLCLILTECDFDTLMGHMREVVDGHVMYQTLSDNYKNVVAFKVDPFVFGLARDYDR